ncbi:ABC transporter ATP-binding protein [Proteinivorax hydrogeniformans]|uniref:ABC transporter ATP-binding protein n=1 Tax=Proteinivorax hydrogeniformans TaxID=1826727 RepID=A0AAU8HUJ2_9FIRM
MEDKLLEFKNISKYYDAVKALDEVSFAIKEGEIVGLIGPNGAGKTTAIQTMMKYITPDSGDVYFKGKNIKLLSQNKLNISYLPDEPVYFEELTLEEHLFFICMLYNYTQKEANESVNYIIDKLELYEHKNKLPDKLSKGTKQKLQIACSLLRKFDVLLADEPFTALDPKQIWVLKELFLEQKKDNKSILVSTHLLDLAETFCDRYICLNKGEIIGHGTKESLIRKSNLCPGGSHSLETVFMQLLAQSKEDETCTD